MKGSSGELTSLERKSSGSQESSEPSRHRTRYITGPSSPIAGLRFRSTAAGATSSYTKYAVSYTHLTLPTKA